MWCRFSSQAETERRHVYRLQNVVQLFKWISMIREEFVVDAIRAMYEVAAFHSFTI